MSTKVKLISIISAFVLVLGIMIIGVLSAEQVKVNIGGSVSFNATNVYARVSGDISGAETGNKTFSTLTYSAEETTGNESDWTNLALEFTETPDPIIITIIVENLSTDRELQVSLENDIQANGLNISITKDSQPYTAGQTAMLAKSTGDGTSTTTFVMSLTVANPDEDLTDANFNYILNLTDESAIKEITVQSADSSMGSVTGSGTFVIGEQVTLTATPGQDYLFTEWRANSADGETVSTSSTYTFTLTSTSPTTYYAVFEQAQAGTLTYTYDDEAKTATVSGCTSGATKVVIPETTIYNGETYTVTGIAAGAEYSGPFYSTRSTLKSITIPSTITIIGTSAFYACRALTEINYNATNANDLTRSHEVFSSAGELGTGIIVNIGANVIKLPDYIFYENGTSSFYSPNITTVNFAEGSVCKSIGIYAFNGCTSLTSITIGESVTSIGSSAFNSCYALAEVYNYSSLTIPQGTSDSSVGNLGRYAKVVYNASDLSGGKPETRITTVGNMKYYDYEDDFIALGPTSKNVAEVILDNRTTEINRFAFDSCYSLTSITIPDGVTSIGNGAFDNCESLTTILIPDSVTSIGEAAFNYCSNLVYNTDENGVNYLGNDSNEYVVLVDDGTLSVADYTIQSTCKVIYEEAFQTNTVLENVSIPDSVTSIGSDAFNGCTSLTSITIPESVTSIGEQAFYNCNSLNEVTVESDDIYLDLTSNLSACGYLMYYVDAGETVRVLKSVVDSVDPNFTVNTYLNGSRFTRSVSEDGLYYVYTKN